MDRGGPGRASGQMGAKGWRVMSSVVACRTGVWCVCTCMHSWCCRSWDGEKLVAHSMGGLGDRAQVLLGGSMDRREQDGVTLGMNPVLGLAAKPQNVAQPGQCLHALAWLESWLALLGRGQGVAGATGSPPPCPTAHRPPHVRGRSETQADPPDEPGRPQPAPQRPARLVLWPLAHQLPCGASPLPLPL